jgi:MFS transporter, ACS family, tartrate transporter
MTTAPVTGTGGTVPAEPAEALARGVSTSMRRLMPLLVGMYVISYLDRINITFTETGLSRDLGLSASAFGLAAGIFFVGYALFEVPSNLVLHRLGARVWLARIMITWGLLSAATAFVWDATSLVVVRVLLGVAEAGFFPGVVYFLSRWFPERDRGRSMSILYLGIVIAAVIGAPLSGVLLELDGVAGLAGWQWMFLIEGLPAVLVGLWVLRVLPDRPRDARWLDAEAASALERQAVADSAATESRERFTLSQALLDRRVWWLGGCYLLLMIASNGVLYWSADLIERIGDLRPVLVGLITGIPFVFGALGLLAFGRLSDGRGQDKRRPVVAGVLLGSLGILGTAVLPPVAGVATLSIAAFGLLGALPAFWVLPTTMMTGRAAAGGVAMVNSIGLLGGLAGPVIVGAAKDATGSLTAGLLILAAVALLGAVATATLRLAPRARAGRAVGPRIASPE